MIDLLLPRTDGGVLAQAIVVAVVSGIALVIVRRNREVTLLVAGLATVAVAWMGLRALH
jgi:hypothetical protein